MRLKSVGWVGMAPRKNRRKACWNCDSEVDLDIMICPYCASDLSGTPSRMKEPVKPVLREAPQPVFRMTKPVEASPVIGVGAAELPKDPLTPLPGTQTVEEITKRLLVTLLYFLLGSVFLLFAFALLFLSEDGTLTLRWNSALWPLFLVLAFPLLGLGLRSWSGLEDDSNPSP